MKYQEFVTIETGKRGGKPCVRGLRITVYEVLDMLANRMSHAEILKDYPDLTEQDILACLCRRPGTQNQIPQGVKFLQSFLIKSHYLPSVPTSSMSF
jgi:uncharacterized protein (DUF433 family)